MSGANRFGQHFQFTSFGESHGVALGCVIDGCPAGVPVSVERLALWMERRRPGQAPWVSARQEPDRVEILSGVLDGQTLGTPIAAIVRNIDAKSQDYDAVKAKVQAGAIARAGHADDLWHNKFGVSDTRGGGRASGRETLARVIAGVFAESFVRTALSEVRAPAVRVIGFASQIGGNAITLDERKAVLAAVSPNGVEFPADWYPARFPSKSGSHVVSDQLVAAVKDGKSYGGTAEIVLQNVPRGLGQPVFHKLKADFASAMMSVGAVSAVEIGAGASAVADEGTEFHSRTQVESPYGGIRGGLSTGEDILIRVHFKPTSTVMDLAKRGRHDPCIVPRALPVLEAMAWLVLADHILWQRLDRVMSQADAQSE